MEPQFVGILGVVVLLVLLAAGVHVAISLGAVALFGLIAITNLNAALSLVSQTFYTTTSNYSFTVLPLFIIMGNFAAASGITEKAYDFATKWLSQLHGGLYKVFRLSQPAFLSRIPPLNTGLTPLHPIPFGPIIGHHCAIVPNFGQNALAVNSMERLVRR